MGKWAMIMKVQAPIICEPFPKCRTRQDRDETIASAHTYNAWYAAHRTCCSNAALFGGMCSIVREHCANNYFHTPLAEHVLLYMTTMNFSILSRVSELTYTGCIYIYIQEGICYEWTITPC